MILVSYAHCRFVVVAEMTSKAAVRIACLVLLVVSPYKQVCGEALLLLLM